MNRELQGSLMLLLTAIIWGTAFVAQSAGMEFIGPFTFNFARSIVGGLALIPVIAGFKAFDKENKKSDISLKNTIIGGIICGTVMFVASALQQCGIALTTAGKAGFITALYIVIVPIAEFFIYKKKMTAYAKGMMLLSRFSCNDASDRVMRAGNKVIFHLRQ